MVALIMPEKKRSKTKRKKCTTKFCRNQSATRPDGRSYGAKCHKCRSWRWRENQPMKAAFHRLKSHAKSRGIEFRISFAYFAYFARKSELIEKTGRTADSLTIDRRDNRKGYIVSNIQVMTRAANSRKLAHCDEIRQRAGFSWVRETDVEMGDVWQ